MHATQHTGSADSFTLLAKTLKKGLIGLRLLSKGCLVLGTCSNCKLHLELLELLDKRSACTTKDIKSATRLQDTWQTWMNAQTPTPLITITQVAITSNYKQQVQSRHMQLCHAKAKGQWWIWWGADNEEKTHFLLSVLWCHNIACVLPSMAFESLSVPP